MDNNEYQFPVCVRCMTYNQASFIEDALNGFTMQQTDFPFVCIVVDDASTDGEPEVIRRYLSSHFDLEDNTIARNEETDDFELIYARHKTNLNCYFVVLFLKYNHYKKKPKDPYFKEWTEDAKYVALCEGDDYWTDPLKLQKQVSFLENHSDYSMCFHRAATLDYIGNGSWLRCFDIEDRDYTSDELFSKWIVPTNSMVFRHECLDYPITHRERILNGDIVVVLSCSHTGKVRGMSDYMSVYRIHGGGVTYNLSSQNDRTMKYPEHVECIRDNFPQISRNLINRALGERYYDRSKIQTDDKHRRNDLEMVKQLFPELLQEQNRINRKRTIKRILFSPLHLISRLFQI